LVPPLHPRCRRRSRSRRLAGPSRPQGRGRSSYSSPPGRALTSRKRRIRSSAPSLRGRSRKRPRAPRRFESHHTLRSDRVKLHPTDGSVVTARPFSARAGVFVFPRPICISTELCMKRPLLSRGGASGSSWRRAQWIPPIQVPSCPWVRTSYGGVISTGSMTLGRAHPWSRAPWFPGWGVCFPQHHTRDPALLWYRGRAQEIGPRACGPRGDVPCDQAVLHKPLLSHP
jgi:hypothetical protein